MDMQPLDAPVLHKPRIGFAGVGWIGRNRMEALLGSGGCTAAAIAEPGAENAAAAAELAPDAIMLESFEDLLDVPDLDGVVIATPSAAHAEQSMAALERGLAVFCQKPLGRNAREASAVVWAARRADRLLGVDLSYRHTAAMAAVRSALQEGRVGNVFAVDLVFHNAYGPDKSWFYDRALSGGGCVIDLGVHLVDLALWTLGFPEVVSVDSQLLAGGMALVGPEQVEDYAAATIKLANGAIVRLTCSWNLHAGQEAEIGASFYGTHGGLEMRNVGGSFYDFEARELHGTAATTLVSPPDAWGGRAALDWLARLERSARFDPAAGELTAVAEVLDRIYGAAGIRA
ncbi:Gfo/Idh/MocA family protein [Devosia oryzisoli]